MSGGKSDSTNQVDEEESEEEPQINIVGWNDSSDVEDDPAKRAAEKHGKSIEKMSAAEIAKMEWDALEDFDDLEIPSQPPTSFDPGAITRTASAMLGDIGKEMKAFQKAAASTFGTNPSITVSGVDEKATAIPEDGEESNQVSESSNTITDRSQRARDFLIRGKSEDPDADLKRIIEILPFGDEARKFARLQFVKDVLLPRRLVSKTPTVRSDDGKAKRDLSDPFTREMFHAEVRLSELRGRVHKPCKYECCMDMECAEEARYVGPYAEELNRLQMEVLFFPLMEKRNQHYEASEKSALEQFRVMVHDFTESFTNEQNLEPEAFKSLCAAFDNLEEHFEQTLSQNKEQEREALKEVVALANECAGYIRDSKRMQYHQVLSNYHNMMKHKLKLSRDAIEPRVTALVTQQRAEFARHMNASAHFYKKKYNEIKSRAQSLLVENMQMTARVKHLEEEKEELFRAQVTRMMKQIEAANREARIASERVAEMSAKYTELLEKWQKERQEAKSWRTKSYGLEDTIQKMSITERANARKIDRLQKSEVALTKELETTKSALATLRTEHEILVVASAKYGQLDEENKQLRKDVVMHKTAREREQTLNIRKTQQAEREHLQAIENLKGEYSRLRRADMQKAKQEAADVLKDFKKNFSTDLTASAKTDDVKNKERDEIREKLELSLAQLQMNHKEELQETIDGYEKRIEDARLKMDKYMRESDDRLKALTDQYHKTLDEMTANLKNSVTKEEFQSLQTELRLSREQIAQLQDELRLNQKLFENSMNRDLKAADASESSDEEEVSNEAERVFSKVALQVMKKELGVFFQGAGEETRIKSLELDKIEGVCSVCKRPFGEKKSSRKTSRKSLKPVKAQKQLKKSVKKKLMKEGEDSEEEHEGDMELDDEDVGNDATSVGDTTIGETTVVDGTAFETSAMEITEDVTAFTAATVSDVDEEDDLEQLGIPPVADGPSESLNALPRAERVSKPEKMDSRDDSEGVPPSNQRKLPEVTNNVDTQHSARPTPKLNNSAEGPLKLEPISKTPTEKRNVDEAPKPAVDKVKQVEKAEKRKNKLDSVLQKTEASMERQKVAADALTSWENEQLEREREMEREEQEQLEQSRIAAKKLAEEKEKEASTQEEKVKFQRSFSSPKPAPKEARGEAPENITAEPPRSEQDISKDVQDYISDSEGRMHSRRQTLFETTKGLPSDLKRRIYRIHSTVDNMGAVQDDSSEKVVVQIKKYGSTVSHETFHILQRSTSTLKSPVYQHTAHGPGSQSGASSKKRDFDRGWARKNSLPRVGGFANYRHKNHDSHEQEDNLDSRPSTAPSPLTRKNRSLSAMGGPQQRSDSTKSLQTVNFAEANGPSYVSYHQDPKGYKRRMSGL